MPMVRMVTSVAGADFAYRAGEEVDLPAGEAEQAVSAGWGELVRGPAPVTPEDRARPVETPEGRTGELPGRGRPRTRRGA